MHAPSPPPGRLGLGSSPHDGARMGAEPPMNTRRPARPDGCRRAGPTTRSASCPVPLRRRRGHERHMIASRRYAFEGRCYVLAGGRLRRGADMPAALGRSDGLADDELVMRGGGAVIGPDDDFVARPVFDEERIVVAELDPIAVDREPTTANDDRRDGALLPARAAQAPDRPRRRTGDACSGGDQSAPLGASPRDLATSTISTR